MHPLEVCLDVDVFIAALTPAVAGDAAARLFERLEARGAAYHEPSLIAFDVAEALAQQCTGGQIDIATRNRGLEAFMSLPLLLQWQTALHQRVYQMAPMLPKHSLRHLSYLAVADLQGVPLITMDRAFADAARKSYRKVYTPEEFLAKRV